MKKNIGIADKLIRLVIAAVISILFITEVITGTTALVFLIVSSILVLTSLINFCPLYLPFGIKTNKKD